MKDNGRYDFENTESSKIITFYKGCIIDAEILFSEIFGSTFIQNDSVSVDKGKPTDFNKHNLIKISKKVTVEIK